jgi:hypothetical protein
LESGSWRIGLLYTITNPRPRTSSGSCACVWLSSRYRLPRAKCQIAHYSISLFLVTCGLACAKAEQSESVHATRLIESSMHQTLDSKQNVQGLFAVAGQCLPNVLALSDSVFQGLWTSRRTYTFPGNISGGPVVSLETRLVEMFVTKTRS